MASMGADISHPEDRLWSWIYPMKGRNGRRTDRTMPVIAIGLPRSGTDSLRHALVMLGYQGVYHGYEISGDARKDVVFWIPLLKRKFTNGGFDKMTFLPNLAAEDFDLVLHEREAVTDVPSNMFGEELMLAYPDAKVILNRRRHVDAWYRSMQGTAVKAFSPFMWWCSWFNTDLFWLWRCMQFPLLEWSYNDFDKHGRQACLAHYSQAEEACKRNNRAYLDWSVEDGWEPLCEYLGKPVPEEPFPRGNAAGEQFQKNMENAIGDCVKSALSRSVLVISVLAATRFGYAWRVRRT